MPGGLRPRKSLTKPTAVLSSVVVDVGVGVCVGVGVGVGVGVL